MGDIKYHQNGIGDEYGEDGTLKNNWNPDSDYGNEYVDVHFRIDADYYQYPFNNYTQEQKQEFNDEARKVLENLGWKTEKEVNSSYCADMTNGEQHLYLHPQDFSGEVLKTDVMKIAEALENNKTFKLRWVDLYKTVYDITDQEYEDYLKTKDAEIRVSLFEKCKTTRVNRFYYVLDMARNLADTYRLARINCNDGKNHGTGQAIEHIVKIIEQMEKENYLISTMDKGSRCVRSINKTEQRKLKIKML